jgi:hypothetical protein
MDLARRLSSALYGATEKGTGLETADVNDQETLDRLRDDAKKQARAQIANDLKKFLKRKNKHSPPPQRRNTSEARRGPRQEALGVVLTPLRSWITMCSDGVGASSSDRVSPAVPLRRRRCVGRGRERKIFAGTPLRAGAPRRRDEPKRSSARRRHNRDGAIY